MKNYPIGIFDSGIGGLTVASEIKALLPGEGFTYLGDTARVPYGAKSRETVSRYAIEVSRFLSSKGIKLLVVACNTASAYALDALRSELEVPVVGVIEPGSRLAVETSKNKKIGVIGTEGTIRSEAYTKAISALDDKIEILQRACPLFVPIAEEGKATDEEVRLVAKRYLNDFKDFGIDTLLLGCTHYPLLKNIISDVMGEGVTLIDSASATATAVKAIVDRGGAGGVKGYEFYVTDSPERFENVGGSFFGAELGDVKLVNLDEESSPL